MFWVYKACYFYYERPRTRGNRRKRPFSEQYGLIAMFLCYEKIIALPISNILLKFVLAILKKVVDLLEKAIFQTYFEVYSLRLRQFVTNWVSIFACFRNLPNYFACSEDSEKNFRRKPFSSLDIAMLKQEYEIALPRNRIIYNI